MGAEETDPCVFRLELNAALAGVCIVHVGDILVAASVAGRKKFEESRKTFNHSGITVLKDTQSLAYLGIEIERMGNQYRAKKKEYAKTRLRPIPVDDTVRHGAFTINRERRKTVTKQAIGSLMWINLTRMGRSRRIAKLSSSTTSTIDDPNMFFRVDTRE